jgi:hypothetical protein
VEKNVGPLTGVGRCRRVFTALATFVLVLSLIGGVGAFVPVWELDDLDDAVSVDVVLAEEQVIEDEAIAARTGDRNLNREFAQVSKNSSAGSVLAGGQVVAMLRNSGIQRAVHPTGPPTVLA